MSITTEESRAARVVEEEEEEEEEEEDVVRASGGVQVPAEGDAGASQRAGGGAAAQAARQAPQVPRVAKLVELSPEELAESKEAFSIFDRNRDGFIEVEKLAMVMRSLGSAPTVDEIKKFCEDNPSIRSSRLVSYEEFLLFLRYKMSEVESDDYIVEAFSHLDPAKEGYASTADLRHIFENIGDKMSPAEVTEMFKEAGIKSNSITFEEFMQMVSK